ncbi:uncharacterized protein [Gossypium hirsutum]|uniref:Uncharacterized protein n=1 Tax=Gossypium hirsutum TaxID=3635 RepID=A0A1U8NGF8_GOSHI|nr:uncharacterized protein LOC107948099 [Gossypium hirsutum]
MNIRRIQEVVRKLCASCPQHGLSEQLLLQYFYEGLLPMEMKMIYAASQGALINMTPQRAKELISTMVANSQQYRPPMEPTRRVHELSTPSMVNKIDELTNVVKSMLAGKSNPTRLCGICAQPDHPMDSCLILLKDTTTQVNAVGNFQGHLKGIMIHIQYQPPKSSLQAVVKRLAVSTEKFQQKTEAQFQELDQQINKLALTVSRLENQGKLPSHTEPSPHQNASTVTIKDGTESVSITIHDHKVEQEAELVAPSELAPHKPFVVPPSYLGKLTQVKKERKEKQILEIFRKVNVGENVSAVLQRKIPPKCKDQCPLKETEVIIQLADRSRVYLEVVLEDVLVKVNELIFLADFYIINMEDDYSKNAFDILLRRPFLSTARAKIDVRSGTLMMEFNGEVVKFNVYEAMGQPSTMNLDLNTMDKLEELMTFKEPIRETVVFMEAPQFPRSQGFETGTQTVIGTFKDSNRGKGKLEQRSSKTP